MVIAAISNRTARRPLWRHRHQFASQQISLRPRPNNSISCNNSDFSCYLRRSWTGQRDKFHVNFFCTISMKQVLYEVWEKCLIQSQIQLLHDIFAFEIVWLFMRSWRWNKVYSLRRRVSWPHNTSCFVFGMLRNIIFHNSNMCHDVQYFVTTMKCTVCGKIVE